jgi:antitoxin MazE
MTAKLIRIGNSRGIRIPKALIEQAELGDDLQISVRGKRLIIQSAKKRRGDWNRRFREAIRQAGRDKPSIEWQTTPNRFDEEEWTW